MKRLTLEELERASQGTYGNISAIARKLRIPRSTLYDFINSNPDAKKRIESLREEFDDLAEETIQRSILAGDRSLLRFYASTKLRNRGYWKENDAEKTQPPEFHVRLTR